MEILPLRVLQVNHNSNYFVITDAKVQKVCEKRGVCALKVTEGGCFFVTFVFFLMGIVPNNHQKIDHGTVL